MKSEQKNLTNKNNVLFKKEWIKYFWVVLLIILVIKNDDNLKPDKTEVKQNQAQEDLTWFAQYACEKEIKARAVYPPSVKVHFRRDNYVKGNSYTMYGTVDSQNAFGAMVQQNFACEAILDKENDKYWINDLNIE